MEEEHRVFGIVYDLMKPKPVRILMRSSLSRGMAERFTRTGSLASHRMMLVTITTMQV